jgi:hypothetical protein
MQGVSRVPAHHRYKAEAIRNETPFKIGVLVFLLVQPDF